MAFTEKYVTSGAAGGGAGTSGDPYTFAESITHSLSNSGIRYNVQSDAGYSIGVTTFGAGTVSAPNVWRGYNSSVGDLDALGRDSTGALVTTNMPDITITANWTMANYAHLQNFDIVGALSSQLIGDTAVDKWSAISCNILNSQNNASAACIQGDDDLHLLNCDLECSGASHSRLVVCDIMGSFDMCRFKSTAASTLLRLAFGRVTRCVFWGNTGSIGINFDVGLDALRPNLVEQSTFYNIGTAIRTANSAPLNFLTLSHNHVTDCAGWINNLYSGTAKITTIEQYNRLRDVTTPRTGVEAITFGEITTDTGGAETDYVDAPNGDFHLIAAAPGYAAGLHGQDIGAEQHVVPAGGGGLLTHPGMAGGMRG